jgi:hypothetical protein
VKIVAEIDCKSRHCGNCNVLILRRDAACSAAKNAWHQRRNTTNYRHLKRVKTANQAHRENALI